MKKTILFFLLITSVSMLHSQVLYEDFESGISNGKSGGLNGTYNGIIPNPAPDAVNPSSLVASYTNNETVDYSFYVDTLTGPVDLSKFNLIKMKVWSPVDSTRVLFKFQGGGNNVEFIRDISEDSVWVEYTFDVSNGASFTGMDLILVSFDFGHTGSTHTFYFDDIIGVEALHVFESFENGETLPWTAINGFYKGVVPNPDLNSINASDSVGMFVKDTFEYSFVLADLGAPIDLAILNQFHVQIRAQAPTQVLLKLEGAGPPIERLKNIGLTNEWQDYTFDFSAAADMTHLSKIVLFFDPAVRTSVDTYYFDNLLALPLGTCKNVTLNPGIIDDFECNRNATYVNGWDSLSVVNNPVPDAVNTSAKVGRYVDPITEQWATLLLDNENPIDLSAKNQLKVKIWSPRIVPILFKLEGGADLAKEIWINVPEAGKWVQYEVDFSGEALKSHRKLDFFFNGGQDPQAGDIYYIDDITWNEKTSIVIEDFEAGAFLPWEPLDGQNLLHGNFAVIPNPDPSGINTSGQVGEYKKGTSPFSTLAAVAPGFIDISSRPQYNVDVWCPTAGTVVFQLESVTTGNKEVERTVETAGEWTTLSFDFTDYQSTSDWASMRLLFNQGVAEEGATYYFDNVTQSQRTIDPCEGTIAVDNIIDDFECQRNHALLNGAQYLSVVGNPQVGVANASTYVGLYEDQPNMPWDALCFDFAEGIELSAFNQLTFQILSTSAVPILMKLEGGSSLASEIWTSVTTPGEWETLSVDFSSQEGMDHRRVCIFFNAGVETSQIDDYYIDNIRFAHAPFTGCLINFDAAAFLSEDWNIFPSDNAASFELVANPDPSGINTSSTVGKAIETSLAEVNGGAAWAGLYTNLPAQIIFGSDKIVKAKIWSPQITAVTLKIESSLVPPPPGSGDVDATLTKTNEWEELTWDFAGTPLTDNGYYDRVTFIFDRAHIPTSNIEYYFDDVQLNAGECSTTSIGGGPQKPGDLVIAPNPVMDELRIDELGRISRLDIFNIYGQRISSIWVGSASSAYMNVSALHEGAYILSGYSAKGELLAISRFVKL